MRLRNSLQEANGFRRPRASRCWRHTCLLSSSSRQRRSMGRHNFWWTVQPTSFAPVKVSPEQPVEPTLVETETQGKHARIYWRREQKYLEALDASEKHQELLWLERDRKEERMQEEQEIHNSGNATKLFGKGYLSGYYANEDTSCTLILARDRSEGVWVKCRRRLTEKSARVLIRINHWHEICGMWFRALHQVKEQAVNVKDIVPMAPDSGFATIHMDRSFDVVHLFSQLCKRLYSVTIPETRNNPSRLKDGYHACKSKHQRCNGKVKGQWFVVPKFPDMSC